MTSQGIPQVVHLATILSISADRRKITFSPAPPWTSENAARGKFVTFERKDGTSGERHIIVASSNNHIKLEIPMFTPFEALSYSLTFWEPEPMESVTARQTRE